MKLLCISRKHPPSVGGMQAMNYEIIRRLAAASRATVIRWGGSQWFLPLFIPWALVRSLALLPRRRRPDAVYLGDALLAPLGLVLKGALRRPVAVSAHGNDIAFRFPLYRTVVGFCLRRLDLVVCVSRYTRGLCIAIGVSPDRCAVVPNGVDPGAHAASLADTDAAGRWLAARGVEPGRPIVLTVARLVARKGVARFVSEILPLVARAHPRVLYLVVGEGKERRAIEAKISRAGMGPHVLLAGGHTAGLRRGFMGLASVFVMPNVPVKGDVEGFGLVALEAGCAGLPLVASDIEGIRDAIVQGENGVLVRWDDAGAFAAAVGALLSDEAGRRSAGAAAREFNRSNFGWDAAAERYLEMIGSHATS